MADPVLSTSLSEKMVVFVDDNTNFLHVMSWLHLQDEVKYIYWKNIKNTKKSDISERRVTRIYCPPKVAV